MFKTYRVPDAEPVADAVAEGGRFFHEAAAAVKDRPEAERTEAHEQLGAPFVHVRSAKLCGNERVVARARGDGENLVCNMVKSSPAQLAAHVRHCRAKPCREIDGK